MTAEDRKDKEDHPPKFENVDTLILDYLIFQATKSSLEDFPYNLHHLTKVATSHDVDSLDLVGAFLSIFQTIHDTIPTGSDVEFRLRLLKFSILFTRRKLNLDSREAHKSIHNKLKQDKNVSRIGRTGSPMEVVDISDDQMDTGESTQKHPNGSLLSNPKPTISLLKSLPDFMALSAVQNARQANTNITETWMKLAAGYMAQAVIEQSLVYQSEEKDILQEAFQWGFDEESSAEEGTDAFLTNIMFFDEEAEEANATWTAIRDGHMRAVMPSPGKSYADHTQQLLQREFPIAEFEARMLTFLTSLHTSLPRPILTQVECGDIDDLSSSQRQMFRERVGLLDSA